jgi:hypothetical protein
VSKKSEMILKALADPDLSFVVGSRGINVFFKGPDGQLMCTFAKDKSFGEMTNDQIEQFISEFVSKLG